MEEAIAVSLLKRIMVNYIKCFFPKIGRHLPTGNGSAESECTSKRVLWWHQEEEQAYYFVTPYPPNPYTDDFYVFVSYNVLRESLWGVYYFCLMVIYRHVTWFTARAGQDVKKWSIVLHLYGRWWGRVLAKGVLNCHLVWGRVALPRLVACRTCTFWDMKVGFNLKLNFVTVAGWSEFEDKESLLSSKDCGRQSLLWVC